VAQARLPAFYVGYGVPDTVQGRFDLIVLHLVLVLARLGRDHEPGARPGRHPGPSRGRILGRGLRRGLGRSLGQGLFDAFCRDLDDNLREMGVGDLAVSREMRRFGEAFYGRQAAYRDALAAPEDRQLEKALARNIFGAVGVEDRAARLARYARAAAKRIDAGEADALIEGKAVFPNPEAFANA
jgi:cytochrome b pre-mRNA-processing protein 3